MEIERKYLVKTLPDHLEQYACKVIEQGYLNTNPVVRIRRSNDDYIPVSYTHLTLPTSTEV